MENQLEYFLHIAYVNGIYVEPINIWNMIEHHKAKKDAKCILLIRVSTQAQDLLQQTEKVKNEAIKDGYTEENIIVLEDKESAIKLSEAERNGLNNLKYHIEHNNVECVYVYEVSRISRQPSTLYHIRDFLLEHKVQLVVLNPYMKMLKDDGTMSETANIFFGIFSSMAENEMYIKKQRMRRGAEYKHEQGKYWGGSVAIGYKIEGEHLVIDEEGASMVRRIFKDYADGWSIRKLAKQLQDEGWRTSTAFLTVCQSILNIIHREYYTGDKWHPQIISRELYDKVQDMCAHKQSYATTNNPALLKGIIYDMESGYLMSSNFKWNQYYSKRYGHCTIRMDCADMFCYGVAKEWYNIIHVVQKKKYDDIKKSKIQQNERIIKTMTEKLTNMQDRIDRIEERYIEGKLSKEKADTLEKKTFDEIQIARKRIDELTNVNKELTNANSGELTEPRDILLDVVERIEVRRLGRFMCEIRIKNRYTGEERTLEVNTRKNLLLNMKIWTRPTIVYKV